MEHHARPKGSFTSNLSQLRQEMAQGFADQPATAARAGATTFAEIDRQGNDARESLRARFSP